jgi:hypothetical protein
VSEPLASVLADLLERLELRAAEARWPDPEAAFAAHVRATVRNAGDLQALAAEAASERGGRWGEAPVLAAAGYLLGGGAGSNGLVDHWREGVARLSERDPFPADRTSFFYRPVELYGLALGARATGGPFATWLADVVADGERRVPVDLWHGTLGAAAASTLVRPWSLAFAPTELPALGVDELALLRWLFDADNATATSLLGEHADQAQVDRLLLERALFTPIEAFDAARAAVIATSLRAAVEDVLESAHASRWKLTRTERDAAELVVHLCRRFPRYVRQLSERHGGRVALVIDDEYDVQDHLHALLRLHFDDVRGEEWTPSYGATRTRMDFLLKREQMVVETKMTRPGLDQRRVVDELIVDKEHYRQHPDCKTLVCFVYDPDQRLTNPDALERDLADDEARLMTRVVVAPDGG